MGEESPKSASTPTGAVFLSYASQDVAVAELIATGLRAAGIEVWFDQSELRGGDAWDQKIRQEIHDCALFLPIVSKHTQERLEGYFRHEWNLAIERAHHMARQKPFLMPVVIDGTGDREALVPDEFRAVQWTRLSGGETSAAFLERVKRLLSPEGSHPTLSPHPAPLSAPVAPVREALSDAPRRSRAIVLALAAVTAIALGYLGLDRWVLSKHPVPLASSQSIAVLPLVNESGDANQQYFSDGLAEDLITALSQVPGLKVIGRSSSFQFRDSKEGSKAIGQKLGVAHLLEGSVRRAGDVVRVSAELVSAVDGSTQWSERYDRPYKDLFALQDDITRAVAAALKVRLVQSEGTGRQSDRPPSGNLEAYNAMLQGRFHDARDTEAEERKAIEQYTLATQLDPHYALAWSLLSQAWVILGEYSRDRASMLDAYDKARAAAATALAVAPDLAAAHVAQGFLLQSVDFDQRGAETEFRRALELAPADAEVRFRLANQLANLGQVNKAIELTRQSLLSDPLRANWYSKLAVYYRALNRLDEGERILGKAIELQPGAQSYYLILTSIKIQRGDAQAALAAAHLEPAGVVQDVALAQALQIGDDRAAADSALATMIARYADTWAYQIAEIYAIRNDADKTFEWLDRAWNTRDGGLVILLYDPLVLRYKDDPRFADFCRKVGVPTPAEVAGRT